MDKVQKSACIASLGAILYGYQYGVIAGLIKFFIIKWELGTIALGALVSTLVIVATLSTFIAGKIFHFLPRKKALFIVAALFFVASLLMCNVWNIGFFWTGRAIAGIAIGFSSVAIPVYLAEISPPEIRGRLVSYNQLSITMGILIGFIAQWYFSYLGHEYLLFVASTCLSLIYFFLLTGCMAPLKKEEKLVDHSLKDVFKIAKKPMWVGLFLNFAQQFTGINTVVFYGPLIMEKAFCGQANFSYASLMVWIGAVNLLSTLTYLKYIDRIGRRKALLIGSLSIAFFLFSLSTLVYLHSFLVSCALVIILEIGFIISFAMSFGPTVILVTSEIFPLSVRSKAVSLCFFLSWICNALISLCFPSLMEYVGLATMLLFFGIISLSSFFFILKWLPETRQKTLEQIEQSWKH